MTAKLNTIENTWESIKKGNFVNDYASEQRTALQKAIDRNADTIRVERKKEVEDGDLQMFDGKGWVQFCIHRARKLINEDRIFVATQERMSGLWINHSNEHVRLFNESLDDNRDVTKLRDAYHEHLMNNNKGINFEKIKNDPMHGYETPSQWEKKMMEQDRDEASRERNLEQNNRRRFA